MFCIHCGNTLPANAFFCPHCGQKVETTPDSSAETPSRRPGAAPVPQQKIDCGLSLAIIAVLVGNVIGIVGLVYSVLASDRLKSGDFEGARRAARIGRIWSWSAIIIFMILLVLASLLLPYIIDLVMQGLTEF